MEQQREGMMEGGVGVMIGLITTQSDDWRHSPTHVIFLDVLGVHSHHLRVCATQGDSFTQTQVRNTGGSIHTTDGGAGCNMAIRQLAKEEAAQILRRSLNDNIRMSHIKQNLFYDNILCCT